MARRWTLAEETHYREELEELYVRQNKTIGKIALELQLAESSIFQRLERLGITSRPQRKPGYLNMLKALCIPSERTPILAEFFGIMLGDGNLTPTQVAVTLGTKEATYAGHVAELMSIFFGVAPRIRIDKKGYCTVYFGSVAAVRWLEKEGLVRNKVAAQVDAPEWIYHEREYISSFLRGFFDTDGSFYLLRFGRQISFTNKSFPLLRVI